MTKEYKSFQSFETKIDSDLGIVESIVAVMGNVDYGRDVIHPGAFTKTITERKNKIKVLDMHNSDSVMRVIGKPIEMREIPKAQLPPELTKEFPEATGALLCKTQFLMDTPEGKGAFERIKANALQEWSIGYDVLDSDFSKVKTKDGEVTVRNLRTIKLYEYSPVIWGMNPATDTLDAKAEKEDTSKAINLSQQVEDVRQAFSSQYNTPGNWNYWVNTVYDEYLIVTYEGENGVQYFRITYTVQDEKYEFAPKAEWVEGKYEFVEGDKTMEDDKETKTEEKGKMPNYLSSYFQAAVFGGLNNILSSWLKCNYITYDEMLVLNTAVINAVNTLTGSIPANLVNREVGYQYSYDYDSLEPDLESKAGRVLSSRNITALQNAIEKLQEVLKAAMPMADEEDTPMEDDEDSKKPKKDKSADEAVLDKPETKEDNAGPVMPATLNVNEWLEKEALELIENF